MWLALLGVFTLFAIIGAVIGVKGQPEPNYLPPDWEEHLKEGLDDPWEEDEDAEKQ